MAPLHIAKHAGDFMIDTLDPRNEWRHVIEEDKVRNDYIVYVGDFTVRVPMHSQSTDPIGDYVLPQLFPNGL